MNLNCLKEKNHHHIKCILGLNFVNWSKCFSASKVFNIFNFLNWEFYREEAITVWVTHISIELYFLYNSCQYFFLLIFLLNNCLHFFCISISNWNPFILQFVSEFLQFLSKFFVHPNVVPAKTLLKQHLFFIQMWRLRRSLELGSNWKHSFDISWERILERSLWTHIYLWKALAVAHIHVFAFFATRLRCD